MRETEKYWELSDRLMISMLFLAALVGGALSFGITMAVMGSCKDTVQALPLSSGEQFECPHPDQTLSFGGHIIECRCEKE